MIVFVLLCPGERSGKREEDMNIGEVTRRLAFNTLDKLQGGKLNTLKEVNKAEIVDGVTPEYQMRRQKALLQYAAANCPYYRERFAGELHHRTLEDLQLSDFPALNKLQFIENYDTIFSDAYLELKDSLAHLTTSGSTGTPFTVLADPEKMNHVNMNFMAVLELNGFRMGMKRGEFRAWIEGKNTISKWRSFKNNLKMIEISNMGDEQVQAIFERIRKEQIQVLVTYSSGLTALTEYAERKELPVLEWKNWPVEMIFTMGEALPQSTREKAEKIFGIRPVLTYGNNENGFIAVSLDGADTYTIDLYSYEIEILKMDSDEPAEEGELGRIVVTDYYNRAFPMIRYDTGDTGKVRRWTDENGRVHAEFTEIYGRRGSLIYNTSGHPLSMHVFMNNLLNFQGILRQAKCTQTGLKTYTLTLNPYPEVQVDEAAVIASYKKYLGDDAECTVEYVDVLPVQQSGKTMVCEQLCEEYLS